jgi:triosephosphate isomerase
MHEFIRETVLKTFVKEIAENVSILYGGSVKRKCKRYSLNQMLMEVNRRRSTKLMILLLTAI